MWHHWNYKVDPSTSDIIRGLEKNPFSMEYTYVICGERGPTGKTRLCQELQSRGYKTVEISEIIYPLVNYIEDDQNHVRVDHKDKVVLIMLNRRLNL